MIIVYTVATCYKVALGTSCCGKYTRCFSRYLCRFRLCPASSNPWSEYDMDQSGIRRGMRNEAVYVGRSRWYVGRNSICFGLCVSSTASLYFNKEHARWRVVTSVTHKATGIFLQLSPLLARDSTWSIPNKMTPYKLCIRSMLTYAAPVWSNTSSSNYCRLQTLQSKCLRYRQLPQVHPHPTSSCHIKRRTYPRLHLSFDR